jgi:hypothetical protein
MSKSNLPSSVVTTSLVGTPMNPVTSSSALRPTGLTVVYWYCASEPTNWIAGDVWDQVIPVSVISTASPLPAATLNVAYSETLSASNTPTSWTLTSGSIPGVSLSSTGVLSGTPTSEATYTIVVTATNAGGTSAPASLSLTVGAPPTNLITNGTFASNITGWSASGGSIVWVNTPLYTGMTGSLQITSSSGDSGAQSSSFAVTAGSSYSCSMQVRAATTAGTFYAQLVFSNSVGGYISSVVIEYAYAVTGGWTAVTGSVTAPASAATAYLQALEDGQTSGGILYLADVSVII